MRPADRTDFVKILNGLALTKPGGARLAPEALDVWWNSMQHWSIEEFRAAASHLARAVEFMPNQFHFEQLRKASGETAAEAWLRVRQRLQTIQWHEIPSLGSRIDRIVAVMGGYRALALTYTEHMPFREKRFSELWDELGEVEEARAALPMLAPSKRLGGPASAATLLENTNARH